MKFIKSARRKIFTFIIYTHFLRILKKQLRFCSKKFQIESITLVFLVARQLRGRGDEGKGRATRKKELFFKFEKKIPTKLWLLSSSGKALVARPLEKKLFPLLNKMGNYYLDTQ